MQKLSQQAVKKLVDGAAALGPVGVYYGDYLATLEGLGGFQDDGQPLELLEGLVRPEDEFPEREVLLLDLHLHDSQPPVVLVHLLSDSQSQGLGDCSGLLHTLHDLAVQPAHFG